MPNKKILLGLLIIFSLSMISATQQTLGTFKQNECVNLIQICANCTYVNISSIVISPLSTQISGEVSMEKLGTLYNYTFCSTSQLGEYIVNGFGDENGVITVWSYNLFITSTGSDLTTSKAITYLFIFTFSIFLFLGLIYLGIGLPSDNKRDKMSGYILAVSNLKYLKFLCIGLAYAFAIFIAYFSWMISYAYLDMPFLSSILQFVFYALAILTLPLFILGVYLTIANLVRDSKISEALSRGFQVNGTE